MSHGDNRTAWLVAGAINHSWPLLAGRQTQTSPIDATVNHAGPATSDKCTYNDDEEQQLYVNLTTFWYGFLALITTIGLLVSLVSNMIIIYLFSRTPMLRRNPSNIIAVNLSLSDLLYCTQWPSVIYCCITQSTWMLEINSLCQTFGFITVSTAMASILTVLAMSIERAIVIIYSIQAKSRFTNRMAWLIVLIIWIVSVCSSLPPLFGKFNRYTLDPSKTSCTLDYLSRDPNHKLYILALYVAYWILPALLITICYSLIIVTFKRSTSSLRKVEDSCQLSFRPWRPERAREKDGQEEDGAPMTLTTPMARVSRHQSLERPGSGARLPASFVAISSPTGQELACSSSSSSSKSNEKQPVTRAANGRRYLWRACRLRDSIRLNSFIGRRRTGTGREQAETGRLPAGAGSPDRLGPLELAPAREGVAHKLNPARDLGPAPSQVNQKRADLQPPGRADWRLSGRKDNELARTMAPTWVQVAAAPAEPGREKPQLGQIKIDTTERRDPYGPGQAAEAAAAAAAAELRARHDSAPACLARTKISRRADGDLDSGTGSSSGPTDSNWAGARSQLLARHSPPDASKTTELDEGPGMPATCAHGGTRMTPKTGGRRKPTGLKPRRQARVSLARLARRLVLPSTVVSSKIGSPKLDSASRSSSTGNLRDNSQSPEHQHATNDCGDVEHADLRRHLDQLNRAPPPPPPPPLTVSYSSSNLHQSRAVTQFRLAKMSFYLILLWFISWSPIATLAMLNSVLGCHRASAQAVFAACTMTKLGPAFDVFIYGISHPKIKSKFRQLIMGAFGSAPPASPRLTELKSKHWSQRSSANRLSGPPDISLYHRHLTACTMAGQRSPRLFNRLSIRSASAKLIGSGAASCRRARHNNNEPPSRHGSNQLQQRDTKA